MKYSLRITPNDIDLSGEIRNENDTTVLAVYRECKKDEVRNIINALNTHEGLVSIAKSVSFIFGNEANYPEGTRGYKLCQKAKELLSTLNQTT